MYNIKDKLLQTGLLSENTYFQKYVDLVKKNKENKVEHSITQSHHIIPQCYFKSTRQKVDNSENNLVNLKFRDHILAHYYLYKAAKDPVFEVQNAKAVLKMSCCDKSILNEDKLLKSLDILQENYELKRNYISDKIEKKVQAKKKNKKAGINKYEKALKEWKKDKHL